jgi:biotin transport system substrate-specific component
VNRRLNAADLAMVAVFAGLVAALGLIPPIYLPISPVPVTAQTLGVILAGAILGARRATASMVLLIALIAIGLPLLSGGRGGLGVFVSPTVGFLIAWIPVAGLIGFFTYRTGAPYSVWKGIIVNVIFGILLMYAIGIGGMMIMGKLTFLKALVANVAFIPGDIAKCVIAALVAKGVHSAYPRLLPGHAPTKQTLGVAE